MQKVALIGRSTLFSVKGGDTIQILETIRGLRLRGIDAELKLTHEQINYRSYKLLHFFNLTRPADILFHMRRFKRPTVVTPIFIDYSEADKQYRGRVGGFMGQQLSSGSIQYLKTIRRWILGRDRLRSLSYLWKGQKNSMLEVLSGSSIILPNSKSELERLTLQLGFNGRQIIVPNGVDPNLFKLDPQQSKIKNLVLCVARIEPLKNQFNLIRALNNTTFKLVIIGDSAPGHHKYYDACRLEAAANIEFLPHMPQQMLVSLYQKAHIHILPSWFETTGLSSLEAALMGCQIVISDKGDAKEYFEDQVSYCDPSVSSSIYRSICEAASRPYNESLRKRILKYYTWQQATESTIAAYETLIGNL